MALACGGEVGEAPASPLGSTTQALVTERLAKPPASPSEPVDPATDYTLFEADPVRPLAVSRESDLVLATNTFDDYLELLRPTRRGLHRCGQVKVGMRPVAVAVVHDRADRVEAWVVNHLSDSISRTIVDPARCAGSVVETLAVGDEPRDIVVWNGEAGVRVFVGSAHRGQHHPDASARSGADLVTAAGQKEHPGLGDVFAFSADDEPRLLSVVNLFTEPVRALAVGGGRVYAAGFRTGNRTSAVPTQVVIARGIESLRPLLARDSRGAAIEQEGKLLLRPDAVGHERIAGGMPAVLGQGRCMPDPRPDISDRTLAQVCVQTDDDHRVQAVRLQTPGEPSPGCECKSGDATMQPITAVVVRFFDSEHACGSALRSFPDGTSGCWLDADPGGSDTPAQGVSPPQAPMAWNDSIRFSLPDEDVFAIDPESLEVQRAFSGVGTVLFNLAVQPGTGKVVATNTEAKNLTRFEGPAQHARSSVVGHLHESQLTVIDPAAGAADEVLPIHLNNHIDYSRCCEKDPRENARSLAFPLGAQFSADGSSLFFVALGSDKLARLDASSLRREFDNAEARRRGELREVDLRARPATPVGPVGLVLDEPRGRLYVKTHFTNEVLTLEAGRVRHRLALQTPEPPSISRGRHVLYDARGTSAHGDSACASCHVFGDFDGLAWDLGDPDRATIDNPGPFFFSPSPFSLAGVVRYPLSNLQPTVTELGFRANKGPMTTQTLRGLANHGPMHWRGDRIRRFQDAPGKQPGFGSLNEFNSFTEFDTAIVGLNGNDRQLPPERFDDFANFALQLTLPPNPVRALDDSLDAGQRRARANYFGCQSISEEQMARRACTVVEDGMEIEVDVDTEAFECRCVGSAVAVVLRRTDAARSAVRALFESLSCSGLQPLRAKLDGAAERAPSPELASEAASRFLQAVSALPAHDWSLDPAGKWTEDSAWRAVELTTSLEQLLDALLPSDAAALEEQLAQALADGEEPLTEEDLRYQLTTIAEVGRLTLEVIADDELAGTPSHRNLLDGCSLVAPPRCRLRRLDLATTCNGCHRLDRDGNAEFGVYRPGFFGTSGLYTVEGFEQIAKVPHLRNAYQKTGMAGFATNFQFVAPSVLGERRGGFFAPEAPHLGPQVRGFGFMRDGTVDTTHRFFGLFTFANTPAGFLFAHAGQPGFDTVLPRPSDRQACVAQFRATPPTALEGAPEPLRLCLASSGLPATCYLAPEEPTCQSALRALGERLGQADLPEVFPSAIPGCFQLGAMLQGGVESGSCYPSGLRERAEMESFMMAFDSNLKPIVGQQVTIATASDPVPELLSTMVAQAEQAHCDIAAFTRSQGYLMTSPDPRKPLQSVLESSSGRQWSLRRLLREAPLTLTCYPPQVGLAEARRSAFSRM